VTGYGDGRLLPGADSRCVMPRQAQAACCRAQVVVAQAWRAGTTTQDPRMQDFAARRVMMVDTQVRPSDVTQFPILDAMLRVPREAFVPDALRDVAYSGENLDIGGGRVVLAPRTLAMMLQHLDLRDDDLVLDVGCALGYSSAVLAGLVQQVVALESEESIVAETEAALAALEVHNVAVVAGPLADGAPQFGPYDAILVQGGVERFPDALAAQLKEGGRVACLFMEGPLGECRIGYRLAGRIHWRKAFHATAPVARGFEKAREFVF